MFESLHQEPQRKTWYLLPIQVLCNLLLIWALLSTANIVFLLPFPYRERLPMFLGIATIGFVASAASAMLSLYRRRKHLVIPSILKTAPVLTWSAITLALGVVLGLSIQSFPNQWTTY